MTDYTAIDAAIAALGLTYTATFVPFSKSRNAVPEPDVHDLSVNWSVSLEKGRTKFETDYMQGTGHLPSPFKFRMRFTVYEAEHVKAACETGKYQPSRALMESSYCMFGSKPLPAPQLRDVLYSLVLDSSALDHSGFESWAADFGHDADSRKAEQTYRACLATALKLRALIGDAALSVLRDAFQDY